MPTGAKVIQFSDAARAVGAEVVEVADIREAAGYISRLADGSVVLPSFASGERAKLAPALEATGTEVHRDELRRHASTAAVGVTGANFAFAATGTVVLESTAEAIRLATTLPEQHVVLLDPEKILADDLAAIPHLRTLHASNPRNYLAYITGPSRTADIERVLTIGVHGPKRLHILLLPGLSADPLEM